VTAKSSEGRYFTSETKSTFAFNFQSRRDDSAIFFDGSAKGQERNGVA
jgi:hypothetical protein